VNKEDYEKIGEILAKYKCPLSMINDFADILENDLKHFNRDRFIEHIREMMKKY